MAASDNQEKPRSRGIYLLPNLFTTAAMFAGFYAIIAAQSGRFHSAAFAIFMAMLLDTIDGRVARMTNTQTDFGAQLDSLADLISFGLAPALVVYQWSLIYINDFGPGWAKLGWLAAFLYTVAAAMRLARFNAHPEEDTHHFIGLPSPTAAAIVTGTVWIGYDTGVSGESVRFLAMFLTLATAALMVSNIRYQTFKDIDYKHKVPFMGVLLAVMALIFVAFDPPKVLFTGFLIYTIYSPLAALRRWQKRGVG